MLDVLERCFADNANAWELDATAPGPARRRRPGSARSVQEELRERHAARAAEQLAAERALELRDSRQRAH